MAYRALLAAVMLVSLTNLLEFATASIRECDPDSMINGHTCRVDVPPSALADSLLQKQFHREAGVFSVQQEACDGIISVGKCWYLSELGQSCESTCAAKHLAYSFAAPKHDMVPLLLGHSPAGKLEPWLNVECYEPRLDRYHPWNSSAWGVPGTTPSDELWKAGQFSTGQCQLACPCGFQYEQARRVPTPPPTFAPAPLPPPTFAPAPLPLTPVLQSCTGIEANGRCWYLSKMGEDCDETCADYDCSYSFAALSETMVPKLIGHEPAGRGNAWAFLECYVPKEDLYHPADPDAWGNPGKTPLAELAAAGQYSHESCRLSCPCAGRCRGYAPTPVPTPTPPPPAVLGYSVQACRGIVADGACWYMSKTGQNCDTTCTEQGSYYVFTAPSEDMTPKLVGHEPSARNNPWLFLECYVPKEDRYHPYNKNAWGVPEKTPAEELPEAGQHTYPTCQLACPCKLAGTVATPAPWPSTPTPAPWASIPTPAPWAPIPTPAPWAPIPTPAPRPPEAPEGEDRSWTHVSHKGTSGGVGYVTDPRPKPTPAPVPLYGGVKAVNRTWFMSGIGESCASTCARQGLTYSWAEPPKDRPITPRLLGFEPGNKQWPWAFVECYVAGESRYHTVNPKAWGVPRNTPATDLSKAAAWTHEDCQLACPCTAVTQPVCEWVQPPACAPDFEYKGKMYTGCPTVDHVKPWCMHYHYHDGPESYSYKWSNCINTCEEPVLPVERCAWKQAPSCVNEFDYEGIHYVGCTTIDHDTPWCSNTDPYQGSWSHCSYDCENPTVEDQQRIDQLRKDVENDDLLCSWRPVQECSATFTYKGFDYEGCALFVDHPMPWCSHDRVHTGKWSPCERFCSRAQR